MVVHIVSSPYPHYQNTILISIDANATGICKAVVQKVKAQSKRSRSLPSGSQDDSDRIANRLPSTNCLGERWRRTLFGEKSVKREYLFAYIFIL